MHLYHLFYSHCMWLTYSSDCSRVSSHSRRRACASAHHQGLRRFSLALQVFSHMLSQLFSSILAGKPQSRGLVVVSFSRSPSFYLDLLKNKGTDVASSDKLIQILDCYSDPLSWKDQLAGSGNFTALPNEALVSRLVGGGNIRFSIAIDSVILSILFANV
ncbi:Serine/threonine-protein kinase CBK1 [Gossypium arboreum]|uniref:Elongator complex protein 5 n=1 Tax=Gossypium arboreum TaxID=29729 RepID=A0A0B0P3A1_GOSAR|nr:Serine/threonine-protein kinase CBK1 [Gossypium arboreum]